MLLRRIRPPDDRSWERGRSRTNASYERYLTTREKGSNQLDLWFAKSPCSEPLLLFEHIRKTAGTSIRHLIHANLGDDGFEFANVPRHVSREWYEGFVNDQGEQLARLRAAAGHSANYLLPLVGERPVLAFTMVREPVDRILSRYYFLKQPPAWTLSDVYLRPAPDKRPEFFNGQARSLLAPHVDTLDIPLTAEDPRAEEWRTTLRHVAETYVVGVQDRLPESIDLFARRVGFAARDVYRVHVHRGRPSRSSLDPETEALALRYNWLDDELYRAVTRKLDAAPR